MVGRGYLPFRYQKEGERSVGRGGPLTHQRSAPKCLDLGLCTIVLLFAMVNVQRLDLAVVY